MMGTKEIIKEIKKLPYTDKMVIVEETLKIINEEPAKSFEKAVKLMETEYRTNKDEISNLSINGVESR